VPRQSGYTCTPQAIKNTEQKRKTDRDLEQNIQIGITGGDVASHLDQQLDRGIVHVDGVERPRAGSQGCTHSLVVVDGLDGYEASKRENE
jgi:hypothetical protein